MKKVFSLDQSTNLFYHNNGRMKSQILLGHVDVVVKKGETNFRCCCFYDFTRILWFTQMSPQIVNIMNNTFSNIHNKHIHKCIMMAFCSNNHRNNFTSENWCVAKNRSTTFFFSQWNINSRELLLESQRINFDFCTRKVYVEHHVFKNRACNLMSHIDSHPYPRNL